ncbi:MAG: GNAT family N-acetyltransferase, partial [Proteobacteria bacterium]|nr:GNAT family N-acetyltransferase [Pseudomonadota bacterium]
KTRSREYIQSRRDHFFIVKIDGIVVGCAEKIQLDPKTAELGALAISSRFRNQQIGLLLIRSFLNQMKADGFSQVVSLTANQKLGRMYLDLGFRNESPPSMKFRQDQSPGVGMYLIDLGVKPGW